MPVKYDVVAVTGKYTNDAGEEKNRYQKLGVILTSKTGSFMLKLEAVPVGWDGWAYLNDPREDGGSKKPPAKRPAAKAAPADEDIPF